MNLRLDRQLARLRLSADEARTLLEVGELFEEAVIRFGVRLSDQPLSLDGLVFSVRASELEAQLARAGKRDAGIYAPGLAVEIDAFADGHARRPVRT